MIDKRLLEILVCPKCHGDLVLKQDRLICQGCGLRYPIRDGIPVMLIEEAEPPESEGPRPLGGHPPKRSETSSPTGQTKPTTS